MDENKKTILWVDQDKMFYIEIFIENLRQKGWQVSTLTQIIPSQILEALEQKPSLFILHSGSYYTIQDGMIGLIKDIKRTAPETKIVLQTESIHPETEGLVDFTLGIDQLADSETIDERLIGFIETHRSGKQEERG